jgi:hypothetical protein
MSKEKDNFLEWAKYIGIVFIGILVFSFVFNNIVPMLVTGDEQKAQLEAGLTLVFLVFVVERYHKQFVKKKSDESKNLDTK